MSGTATQHVGSVIGAITAITITFIKKKQLFFDTLLGGKDEKKDCCNYVLSVGMIEISGTQEGRSTTMLKLT